MSDDVKKINLIAVEDGTFAWVVSQANACGKSVADFVGLLVDEVALTWRPPTDEEPDRLLFWDWVQSQQEEHKRKMVYQAAAIYQSHRNPTEEEAERLARMCETAGLDYTEVIKEISSDPFSSIIVQSRNGTATGQCMRWLADVIREREHVPVKIIRALANKDGFSQSTLDRARAAINMDAKSPSIKTRRSGPGWEWYVGEEEIQVMHD